MRWQEKLANGLISLITRKFLLGGFGMVLLTQQFAQIQGKTVGDFIVYASSILAIVGVHSFYNVKQKKEGNKGENNGK